LYRVCTLGEVNDTSAIFNLQFGIGKFFKDHEFIVLPGPILFKYLGTHKYTIEVMDAFLVVENFQVELLHIACGQDVFTVDLVVETA
jgi:hypothetical protein